MPDNDIDIARAAHLHRITDIARQRLGIDDEHLVPYGHHKAKLALPFIASLAARPRGRLVLVTAISPTPAGEGKTTTTIGLGDAMAQIGKKTLIALREPSLGPVFGLKGGATGGGRAQVAPMEDINLHFNGDFHAIASAHNLLAAAIDNHIHHGNALDLDLRRISWRRVMDMNDRALRQTTIALGGPGAGFPRQDGFDIVAASEVMAILCLSESLADLKQRLARIVVAETRSRRPVLAAELGVHGAMAVLLKDALAPNLVQTLENNPALVHGGPFANIAHGCNSVLATRAALHLADYVVTEAGFGADLGAEKFIDIKCRASGLRPAAAVLVATVRALKFHGGVELADLGREDLPALQRGMANLERHLHNLREVFGLPCVVAINHFAGDTEAEHALLRQHIGGLGVAVHTARHYTEGGRGATALAQEVVRLCEQVAEPRLAYADGETLWDKINLLATRIYGAAGVRAAPAVRARIEALQAAGHGHLPVCVAKTQYSFSTDAKLRGAPSGHLLDVREVRLAAGAGFVVMICGEIMTMPGLPRSPAAERIDLDEAGEIVGLS
ncbi:Formate--tetrahydrofolate ligase [Rubrivivax sp. A210]|uniref:formate--tetrahydrofolate ligase n=1 Tax=Rubrivivax sp. A210 TaxID=2772301 RepID=UPI0019196095|nr:formate--tetrahydrofolate ligase [Rubrivivax sp. A210]CAD5366170.1 Formate--tetrahydrofolate ligase [Rubrivivax sp. A210]